MAELTEDRIREIIKEEIAKAIPEITVEVDSQAVTQAIGRNLVDQIRLRSGKRL